MNRSVVPLAVAAICAAPVVAQPLNHQVLAWTGQPLTGSYEGVAGSIDSRSVGPAGGIGFTTAIGMGAGAAARLDSAGASVTFAHTGQQAPGTPEGQVFAQFGALHRIAGGDDFFAFRQHLTGPGVTISNLRGIWATESAGPVALVIRQGDSLPALAAGESVGLLNQPIIAGARGLAFVSEIKIPGLVDGGRALWTYSPAAGLSLIARTGMPAPGTPSEPFILHHTDPELTSATRLEMTTSRAGQIVFNAATQMANGSQRPGIWTYTPQGGVKPVAAYGFTSLEGLDPSVTIFEPRRPVVNPSGEYAFRSFLVVPGVPNAVPRTSDTAVIVGTEGNLRVLAREGETIPDRPLRFGVFTGSSVDNNRFFDPSINGLGAVAFAADVDRLPSLSSGGTGVFLHDTNTLHTLAIPGDVPVNRPDLQLGFISPRIALNEFNDVAFFGGLPGVNGFGGLFVSIGGEELHAIAVVGDQVTLPNGETRIIEALGNATIFPPAWDDERRLYYWADFQGRASGLMVVQIPAPGAGAALLLGAGAVVSNRRRCSIAAPAIRRVRR